MTMPRVSTVDLAIVNSLAVTTESARGATIAQILTSGALAQSQQAADERTELAAQTEAKPAPQAAA